MILYKRCYSYALFACVLAGCRPASAPPEPTPSPVADAARTFLDVAVENEEVAGAVALVARGDEIVFFGASGMADRENARPMTTDTIFRIASMTKPITSVAVMMLYEEGRLGLDDPVSDFIPELGDAAVVEGADARETTKAANAITIKHLLTHTSGITYRFMGIEPLASIYGELGVSDGLVQTDGTIEEGVKRLARAPLLHDPGAAWSYGLSTDVLGRLVEVVAETTLDAFFTERILEPLGMDDTHFFLPESKTDRFTAVYESSPSGGLERLGDEPITSGPLVFSASYHYEGPRAYFSGGAGLVSTTGDYFRFARMLASGGELGGVRLLQSSTVDLMTQNQIGELSLDDGAKFGLGFRVTSEATELGGAGTFGWGGFFHTRFWIDPENDLIGIFMSQLRPAEGVAVHDAFTRAVYHALRN